MRIKWAVAALLCLLLALPAMAEEGSLSVLGVDVPQGAVTVDLTSLTKVTKKQAQELSKALGVLPDAAEVDLRGVTVDRGGQSELLAAHPGVHFLWEVSLAGVLVDGDATELNIDELGISAKTELKEIRAAIACLPKLEHVTMYSLIYAKNTMEKLLADYPDVQFDWSIHWNICSGRVVNLRTDATAFSTLKGRQDPRYTASQIMDYLQYTPDLLAIDVGHNNVSDLSFLANWPGLRRLICIDSKKPVTDISVMADLPDLEYVELFMQNITDLSPLANHTKLLDLNLCHNSIEDFSPLYSCTSLERLYISNNPGLNDEAIAALQAALPNCLIETEVWGSTDAGWREHPRYFTMYQSFEDNTYYPFEDAE
ncbi:MAG: hypothetical protein J1E43_06785 [Christensenellaceae bacterium]|nr:hypothetical protein [Christensenellaceae bacterium]